MAHPIMFDDADPLLGRLRTLALALPEAPAMTNRVTTPGWYRPGADSPTLEA